MLSSGLPLDLAAVQCVPLLRDAQTLFWGSLGKSPPHLEHPSKTPLVFQHQLPTTLTPTQTVAGGDPWCGVHLKK